MVVPIFFAFPTFHVSKEPGVGVTCVPGEGYVCPEADAGAALGPQYLLGKNNFLDKFPLYEIHDILSMTHVSAPYVSHGPLLSQVGSIYKQASEQIRLTMKKAVRTHLGESRQVMLGGDHSVASTGLAALLDTVDPNKLGVIMIDSHGDLHTKKTSPSGSYHGMWLRPHVDPAGVGIPTFDAYTYRKIRPNNLLYIGNLDLEPEEQEYMRDNGIRVVSKQDFVRDERAATEQVARFIESHPYNHISIDIDAFDKRFAPGTGLPAEDGLSPQHILPILRHASASTQLSVDLVEIYPQEDRTGRTVRLGQRLLREILGAQ